MSAFGIKRQIVGLSGQWLDRQNQQRMKEIYFPDWPQRLARAALPEGQKQSYAITLRWYLSFCRRGRGGVNVQSARDFIEWVEREKRPEPWKLESWREALRWLFRAAKAEQADCAAEGEDQALGTSSVPESAVAAESAPGTGSAMTPPAWKAAFVATVRRRHYSYRTEQS